MLCHIPINKTGKKENLSSPYKVLVMRCGGGRLGLRGEGVVRTQGGAHSPLTSSAARSPFDALDSSIRLEEATFYVCLTWVVRVF